MNERRFGGRVSVSEVSLLSAGGTRGGQVVLGYLCHDDQTEDKTRRLFPPDLVNRAHTRVETCEESPACVSASVV